MIEDPNIYLAFQPHIPPPKGAFGLTFTMHDAITINKLYDRLKLLPNPAPNIIFFANALRPDLSM
jgi:hypothetical protein